MPLLLAVALGGALGSMLRYGVDRAIERQVFTVFPWSTFAINVTGCFLAGLAIAAVVDRHEAPAWVRAGLVVGALGGYTTFSTFAQEALDLLATPHVGLGVVYAVASVAAGIVAVYAGAVVGRAI